MNSEAQVVEERKPVQQWQGVTTDLASFNAYGVVTLSDGQQVNVQMTLRHGLAPEKAYDDFKNFVKLLDLAAQDHAVKFWDGARKGDVAPVNGNGSTHTAPSGNGNSGDNGSKPKLNYKDPIPQGALPEELVEVNKDVYAADFDYILIKSDLDDKSVVEFWKDDLKYAVGAKMNKWKHDTIKQKLAELDLAEMPDPSKTQKIRVAGIQYWTKGSEYEYVKDGVKHTTNYKDLLLLKPIF
jgi:hypothetical protein